MKKRKVAVVLIGVFTFSIIAAGEVNTSPACQNIQNTNDILKCASENHAEVQLSKASLEESKLEIDVAGQMPNPEFEMEAIDNKDGSFTSEIGFLHTFELGGKRSARKNVASSENKSSEIDFLKTKESVIIQTVLALYRYRQIEHEIEVVKENLDTFVRVKKQYKRLGRMSPEQNFSLSIFKIAGEENHLRLSQLNNERNQIASRLRLAVGKNFDITKNLLPKRQSKWPKLKLNEMNGSIIKGLDNDIAISKSKYNFEKSNSWPDLTVGPKVEITNGSNSESKIGFALSLPLPLYQANGAGRAKALSGIRRSELKAKLKKRQLKVLRANLLNVYTGITNSLAKAKANSGISSRHAKLHKLLDRGIVQSSLIIELHREILEFYERLHEQELTAVEAQWKIYAMDGNIFEEIIK